jgi:hypothetical protein
MLQSKSIDQITWEDIELFCQERPPEGAYLDYKRDFPANLEKTIAAMANTFGGIILIGVAEDDENKPVLPLEGIEFKKGLEERVSNIILSNITPPIFPEVAVCRNSEGTRALVVVRIPESNQTPHAISNNTTVYLRTGSQNNPEALAQINEVEWLRDKRSKSEDLRIHLYEQAHKRFTYLHRRDVKRAKMEIGATEIGEGLLTLSLCPLYPKDVFLNPPDLKNSHHEIQVRDYFGSSQGGRFPIWSNYSELTLVEDGFVIHTSNYSKTRVYHTELNCYGLYYFRQSLMRPTKVPIFDGEKHVEQEVKLLRSEEIFCRIDEFIDSAIKYYRKLGYWGLLQFRIQLANIQDCVLRGLEGDFPVDAQRYESPDPAVRFDDIVLVGNLQSQKQELILRASQHICWAFGWDLTQEDLDRYYQKSKR